MQLQVTHDTSLPWLPDNVIPRMSLAWRHLGCYTLHWEGEWSQHAEIRYPAARPGHSPCQSVIRTVSSKMIEGRLVTGICVLYVGLRITGAVPVEVESQSEWVVGDKQLYRIQDCEIHRLKDNGDGLTGPQPSVLGSVDKVFKQVTNFDQYQCLQKMVCEFMGAAGDTVTNAVTSNFNNNNNGQLGQIASQNFQQFASNPNQFIQQFPGQQGQQFSNQLGIYHLPTDKLKYQIFYIYLHSVGNNRPLGQLINNGQQFVQSGQQFVTTGQQLVQNQYPNQFNQFQVVWWCPQYYMSKL